MKLFSFCISVVCLCGPTTSIASETYKARELIDMAVEKNPELRALTLETQAHEILEGQATRWANPHLELGGEQKEEPEGRTQFTRIGLSQALARPGLLRARGNAAKATTRQAELDRQSIEINLRGEVLALIYAHKIASEKAEHARERLERFQTVSQFLSSRVFAAPQKRAEAVIVRSKLMVLKRELRGLEVERKIAWNRLNLFLGLPSQPVVQAPWYNSGPDFQLSTLLSTAEQTSPTVKKQALKSTQIESELNIARLESWPGLTLSGEYANGVGARPEKVFGLALTFPIPVFDSNRGTIESHEHQLAAEQQRVDWTRRQTTQELQAAFEHYQAAMASLAELKIEQIPGFEKDMKSIDQGFKRGQVDLLTFIEADAEHFESLNAILETQLDFVKAYSSLALLLGQAPQILE